MVDHNISLTFSPRQHKWIEIQLIRWSLWSLVGHLDGWQSPSHWSHNPGWQHKWNKQNECGDIYLLWLQSFVLTGFRFFTFDFDPSTEIVFINLSLELLRQFPVAAEEFVKTIHQQQIIHQTWVATHSSTTLNYHLGEKIPLVFHSMKMRKESCCEISMHPTQRIRCLVPNEAW